ncbi:helix-turn-helix domain-containing protein [Frankia sp. CNm7]|uniref:Helix-turn-helix domain-containing protein n=1 Tax=Frankia nepalensis TaxID=1836974 RepID=A0A937RCI0_9ACTN|nr:helix-turn-helix transcriptional regulator [Frankia nepalensis]MBL7499359.1 helix-turn-helix domain-containing protein [Frankia nepalensis]MBL7514117.1 helix-turn-helix domain-containing protein [Frankia nepalensis]MBL7519232.1 helix-turn-helix domain-containing protein [Frankia nepalensis]MBL7626374.1 helix-turn-helix domain-containing protein [Frankia nepalensis]
MAQPTEIERLPVPPRPGQARPAARQPGEARPAARASERRAELASFLRSRRERVSPEDVGMPPGPRRRTPGLRREEVAQLSGVGVTWYTWLEQGRPINASTQVLDAVARTLRLDGAEREHLFRLADVPRPATAVDEWPTVTQDLRVIMEGLDPLPASLVTARSDVLAWNGPYAAMFPDIVNAPVPERNSMWFMFTAPPDRNPIVNLDEQAPEGVAVFRYRYSQHLGEPEWLDFIHRLCAASPLFARLWATQNVAPPRPCEKRFQFPGIGPLTTRATHLDVAALPGLRLLVYTPVDDTSRDRLARLHARATATGGCSQD